MNKKEIGLYASKVWHLLVDNSKWSYTDLKRRSELNDSQLGAALGWLAHENKIDIDQDDESIYVSMYINVYIG
jgi:hypothetical protein